MIAEYRQNQEKEEIISYQKSIKEYIDPINGKSKLRKVANDGTTIPPEW